MENSFKDYLKKLQLKNQTEFSNRTQLHNLLNNIVEAENLGLKINQEEQRSKEGAPDFTIKKQDLVIGYIETKKIDENLSKVLKSAQIKKYKRLSENILLTDYLEFIWMNNESIEKQRLCKSHELENKNFQLNTEKVAKVYSLIRKFFSVAPTKITKREELAKKLAFPSREVRDYIEKKIENQAKGKEEKGKLYGVYEIFKRGLFTELNFKDFADSFAQMLTYTLLLAKLESNKPLSLKNCADYISSSFSLIKALGDFIAFLGREEHKSIHWALDNILSVINNTEISAVLKEMETEEHLEKDFFIYFYESFLKEYDARSKVDKGVFYTPPTIVGFIVREVSNLLAEHFDLPQNGGKGLANKKVKLLDFACGTSTFLLESYRHILQTTKKNTAQRKDLIENHLLKNLFGFEIMISSYVISHLKLSQFLKEQGYDLAKSQQKIPVYLTNTLEDKKYFGENLLAKEVSAEGKKAKEVKADQDIIAIIGNPPYNVGSKNKLSEDENLYYFHKNYKPEDEIKINIDDDYIKFIAFAHQKIKKIGKGVIGVIVNNSFLTGITHRKMRSELVKDFEKIYIIDLHGNTIIGEKDQNVFDIRVGVCICLFVKNENIKDKGVFHHSIQPAKRKDKLQAIQNLKRTALKKLDIHQFNQSFRSTNWGKKRFQDELSFFKPIKKSTPIFEYGRFWGLTDIFQNYISGIDTKIDSIAIDFDKNFLQERITEILTKKYSLPQIIEKYKINKNTTWEYSRAIKASFSSENFIPFYYRPFDKRYIFYSNKFLSRSRKGVMDNFFGRENLGLGFCRQGSMDTWQHCLISTTVMEFHYISSNRGYYAPLYLYTEEAMEKKLKKEPNFQEDFIKMIKKDLENPTPEQVMGFIYANLYCSSYRKNYQELLKIDFPRINFAVSKQFFQKLAALGWELIQVHTFKKIPQLDIGDFFYSSGYNEEVTVKIKNYQPAKKRIYINQEHYFAKVEKEVWEFQIGGYQVLNQYLKVRNQKVLTNTEIQQITHIIKILHFTLQQMKKIDSIFLAKAN